MQKTRRLLSILLAVMMVLSMCTVGMFSASAALPEGAVVDTENAGNIDGEVYGLIGDADLNETINVRDVTEIQKFAAKIVKLTEKAEALADVDFSDVVNVKDATAIQKWLAKYEIEQPVGCMVYLPTEETTAATEATTVATEPSTEATADSAPVTTVADDKPVVTGPIIIIPTVIPDETEATKATDAPEVTEATKATDAPEITEATKATDAPEVTEATKATDATEATEATKATDATEATTEAEVTTAAQTEATTEAEATTATQTEATTEADDGMITVYFAKPADWADAFIYGFYGVEGESADVEWPAVYPGSAMTFVETDENGNDIYSCDVVPDTINYIKFTDGTGSDPNCRTTNVPSTDIFDGAAYTIGTLKKTNQWNYAFYDYTPAGGVVTDPVDNTTAPEVEDTTATEAEDTTAADDGMITVYFTNNKGWADAYIYAFYGEAGGTPTGEPLGAYPGAKMTYVRDNSDGQAIYCYDVPADVDFIKFCDGKTAANERTDNIPNAEFEDGTGFYLLDKGTKYWPYETYTYGVGTDETTPADTTAPAEDTTVAEDTTAPADDPVTYTVYAINSAKWVEVAVHAWNEGGSTTTWPGFVMTKTGETVNGFDVYEYTFTKQYAKCIFNNNNNGSQTTNLDFNTGKYFDIKAGKWYNSLSEVPTVSLLSTDRYLAGSFNGWSTTSHEFMLSAEGDDVAYLEIELKANTTYEFKIVREGTWTSCKDTLSITDTVEGLQFSSSVQDNCTITTKEAGTYVFAFGMSDSKLSVTYP